MMCDRFSELSYLFHKIISHSQNMIYVIIVCYYRMWLRSLGSIPCTFLAAVIPGQAGGVTGRTGQQGATGRSGGQGEVKWCQGWIRGGNRCQGNITGSNESVGGPWGQHIQWRIHSVLENRGRGGWIPLSFLQN